MDPAAIFLHGFLSAPATLLNSMSRDRNNMDAVTIEATHLGIPVSYTYQLWRIKTPTVCARYKQDMAIYAKCTEAAQALFYDACKYFTPLKTKDYPHRKAAEMYCYAANAYQPIIARIRSPGANAKLEEARAACNAAVAGMIGGGDGRQKAKKEKACGRYESLRSAKAK